MKRTSAAQMSLITNETSEFVALDDDAQDQIKPPAKRLKTALNIRWFKNQAEAFEHATAITLPIKLDMYEFGNFKDRESFVAEWCSRHRHSNHPIYELLVDGPCRLYFDIELEGLKPSDADLKAWLLDIIAEIATALRAIGVDEKYISDVLVGYDCRESKGFFKRSFHLVYPEVVFENNHTHMKEFVVEEVKPRITAKKQFKWVAEQKKADVVKYAIDFLVYTRNRPWRVMFSRKQGKTALIPWDIDHWAELLFDNDEDVEEWFDRSLCGRADTECGAYFKQSSRTIDEVMAMPPSSAERVEPVQASPHAPRPRLEPGNAAERIFVEQAILLLAPKRRAETAPCLQAVYAIATVFGKDETGLRLADTFCSGAPNYDRTWCAQVYNGAMGLVGLGSIITWLREDQPIIAPLLEAQLHSKDDCPFLGLPPPSVPAARPEEQRESEEHKEPEEQKGQNIDERNIVQWIEDFNKEAEDEENQKDLDKKKRALLSKIVAYMNTRICIIRRSTGKPNVIEEVVRPERKLDSEVVVYVTQFVFRSPSDALLAYTKYSQHLEGENKTMNPMARWLAHPEAREYDFVGFDPSGKPPMPNMFNLYRGLAIPRALACEDALQAQLVIDHIFIIWCNGNKKHCDFLLDWMAHLVQRPGVKMIACPVLKGGQGAGKGIIIQMLGDILGAEHFIHTTRLESITGTFQEDKIKTNLLTFLDECTFAGDKKMASTLKGLLSESTRKWEAKFVNPITIENHSNFIVASNYDEIVLVEPDDRRWFCLEVNSKYAGPQTPESAAYFDALSKVDVRHFAHFLYNRDISSYNPQAIPSSPYHRHQKLINFDAATTWLEQVLREGTIQEGTHDLSADQETNVAKAEVYRIYSHTEADKFKRKVGDAAFWKKLKELLPSLEYVKSGPRGKQMRFVTFPPLPRCRELFQMAVKEHEWDWGT